jgi:Sel1 repeat
MGFARTPPADAMLNLSKWLEWARIHNLRRTFRERKARLSLAAASLVLVIVFVGPSLFPAPVQSPPNAAPSDATAIANLGALYATGSGGVQKDDHEAARLFKLSADQGSAVGQNYLAQFYLTARGGLQKDDREAARLYKLSADQGNALARADLGIFFEKGSGGLPKDEAEAARLYKLSADQGRSSRRV